MKMKVLKGQAVFEDVVFGKIYFCEKSKIMVPRYTVKDVDAELLRYERAKEKTANQLHSLYEDAKKKVLSSAAMIFEIHRMILEDFDYCNTIIKTIKAEKQNAEYAVDVASKKYSKIFSLLDNEYMRERAADVADVSNRLIAVLKNEDNNDNIINIREPVILAAGYFSPGETIKLDKSKVLGFVTQKGSKTSHAAILSKTMGIPAVVGVGDELGREFDGCDIIVDSFTGEVYINPDIVTVKRFKIKQRRKREQKKLLKQLKGKKDITRDGKKIGIYADIGNLDMLESVRENNVRGIGLFRTEFLGSNKRIQPSQEEQFEAYKSVAKNLKGKICTIRTFDIGSDGKFPFIDFSEELNPALGMRAVRVYFEYPEFFKNQIKAILRAALYGNFRILIPLISSVEDILIVKRLVEESKKELRKKGIPFKKNVEIGIIIETPSAVMLSNELAKEVDFFNIGTNDLTQYTFAMDRQNKVLAEYVKSSHKAILKMMQIAVDNAHQNSVKIGICGELASDLDLIPYYLALGIDEISTSPDNTLKIRKLVRDIDISKTRNKILAKLQ